MGRRPTAFHLATILFVSGYCSLVYQVVWLRLLRHVFGVSTAATAVVLAIFMGGLGLGGRLLGRRADQAKNPLAFYAVLEIGIALTTAASPLLIDLSRQLYVALGGISGLGSAGATALRLVLAAIVLGIPTTLMGGTLPAAARALERNTDRGRRLVAVLYGVNTFGAVTGAFLTTFVTLELLGVRQSLWLACAINLMLALLVRAMSRTASHIELPGTEPAATPDPSVESFSDEPPPSVGSVRVLLGAAGLVGFIFFLMEIVWYRMLAPVLGGSAYTFGLILAVALAGIAGGGLLYSLGATSRRPTLGALARTCLLEALALALPFALGDGLALLAAVLRQLTAFDFPGLVLSWTLVTAIVVLPAALVAGYQFPLLVALLGSGRHRVGAQVGLAYAWNTWGAILGSLAGGFWLLPRVSAPRLWQVSIWLLLASGVLLAIVGWRRDHPWRRRLAPLFALAAILMVSKPGPTAFWRHQAIGAGRASSEPYRDSNIYRRVRHQINRDVRREMEGRESSVAVIGQQELGLLVNGKSDSSAYRDAPTTVMLGIVPGLLHPAPRDVLVVGLGTGATAGWVAEIDSVERVDVVELEPAVGQLADEFFRPISFDVLRHPKVRMIYGDAQEFVHTTSATYDLIISEPSNPYRAGVADLYTQEFYRGVLARLRPDGILGQWLQGYSVDAELVQRVYSTMTSVFASVETWSVVPADLLLLATPEPILHDFDRIRSRVGTEEPFLSALQRVWWVDGLDGFYSGFVGSSILAHRLAELAGHEVATEDRPILEFGFARNVGREGLFDPQQLTALAQQLAADQPERAVGASPSAEGMSDARWIRRSMPSFLSGVEVPIPSRPSPAAVRTAYLRGRLDIVGHLLEAVDFEARHPLDRLLLAEALAERAAPEAEVAIADLRHVMPAEAGLISARLAWRQDDPQGAAQRLRDGFDLARNDPYTLFLLLERSIDLAVALVAQEPAVAPILFTSLGEPFATHLLDERRLRARITLLPHLDFASHCVEIFAPFEPFVPWEEPFLRLRLQCYETVSDPLRFAAAEDLGDFLEVTAAGRAFETAQPEGAR